MADQDPEHPYLRDEPSATEPADQPDRRSGSYLWRILIALFVIALISFLALDLYYRDRYRMVCRDDQVILKRGRTLPFPFGFRALDGNLRPLVLVSKHLCITSEFTSKTDAEAAFFDILVRDLTQRVQRAAPPSPTPRTRQDSVIQRGIERALTLVKRQPSQARKSEIEHLVADLAQRNARDLLASIGGDLRAARLQLRAALKRDRVRYRNLIPLIRRLELILEALPDGRIRQNPTPEAPRSTQADDKKPEENSQQIDPPKDTSTPKHRTLPHKETPDSTRAGDILM